MSIQYKAVIVTGAITSALAIVGLANASIYQPAKSPATTGVIPVKTGQTMVYPNVTPQTAAGNFQGSNYQVQTTALGIDQYNHGTIR